MDCTNCRGTGKVMVPDPRVVPVKGRKKPKIEPKKIKANCFVCNGTGEVCDNCGEAGNVCDGVQCTLDEEDDEDVDN